MCPNQSPNASERIKDVLAVVAFMATLFLIYCAVVFVTAAYIATGTGVILWGEGWEALKYHLTGE